MSALFKSFDDSYKREEIQAAVDVIDIVLAKQMNEAGLIHDHQILMRKELILAEEEGLKAPKLQTKKQQKKMNVVKSQIPPITEGRRSHILKSMKPEDQITQDDIDKTKFRDSFQQACFKCHCARHQIKSSIRFPNLPVFKRKRVHFKNSYKICKRRIVLCCLHCGQRLTEKFLSVTICTKDFDEEAGQFLSDWCSKPSNLSKTSLLARGCEGVTAGKSNGEQWGGFTINFKDIKAKGLNDNEIDQSPEVTKVGMIMWYECRILTYTHQFWIHDLNQYMSEKHPDRFRPPSHDISLPTPISEGEQLPLFVTEENQKLWDFWLKIWKVLHATSSEIREWKDSDKKEKRKLLEDFGTFFYEFYNDAPSSHYPIYLHIIVCHLMDMIEEFGSLCLLSNQGPS